MCMLEYILLGGSHVCISHIYSLTLKGGEFARVKHAWKAQCDKISALFLVCKINSKKSIDTG